MYDKYLTYKEVKYYQVWSKKWLRGLVMNSFSVFGTHAQSIFLLCVKVGVFLKSIYNILRTGSNTDPLTSSTIV
jgi:hypothetical protein